MTFRLEELPPLDRDIADLLANAERAPPSPAAIHLRHHIRRRVGATLAAGVVVSAAVGVTAGTTSAAGVGATASKATGLASLMLGKAKLALVVVGCASAGAVGYGYVKRGPEAPTELRQHVAVRPVRSHAIAPEPEPETVEVAPPAPLPEKPHVPAAAPSKATARARATDVLLDEQRLLARARAALAEGDSKQALAYLQRHALTYPRGKLGEEREAMAVRVLVRIGKVSQARERARAFLAKYPHSIQRPVVEGSLQMASPVGSVPLAPAK